MKAETIRARVNPNLKRRLHNYIAEQTRRGRSVTESTVIVDATVEYLERNEGNAKALPQGAGCAKAPIKYPSGEGSASLLNEGSRK